MIEQIHLTWSAVLKQQDDGFGPRRKVAGTRSQVLTFARGRVLVIRNQETVLCEELRQRERAEPEG